MQWLPTSCPAALGTEQWDGSGTLAPVPTPPPVPATQLQEKTQLDPRHDYGQLASRKKKLEALGAEKHEDGRRWKWSIDGDRRMVALPVPSVSPHP